MNDLPNDVHDAAADFSEQIQEINNAQMELEKNINKRKDEKQIEELRKKLR